MRYRLEIKASAAKQIERLSRADQRRVMAALAGLVDDPRPHGARKMVGMDEGYRVRVGDYRIVYEIVEGRLVVYVVRVGHRKDVNRGS